MNKFKLNVLKNKIVTYRQLIENFSYMSLLQFFNVLLPFASYPYLIRVLGTSVYGEVIFAQVVATYFGLIINFGFNITATKDVSINRDNKDKLSEVVSSVFILKIVLWIISFVFLIAVVYVSPKLHRHFWLYIISFGVCFNELLFPQWYFLGIEKMKYITIISLISKLFFLVCVFIFIENQNDYLYVPILNSIGALVAGTVAIYMVFGIEKTRFQIPSILRLICYFKESFPLFLSRISAKVYVKANALVVGSFLGMAEVAYYDLAEKIVQALKLPLAILSQTIYPKISREKNMKFVLRLLKYSLWSMVILTTIVMLVSSNLILLVGGEKMINATNVLIVLSLTIVPVTCSNFFGTQILVSFGYQNLLVKSMISALIVYVFVFGILFAFNYLTLISIAFIAVIVEVFLASFQYKLCRSKMLI